MAEVPESVDDVAFVRAEPRGAVIGCAGDVPAQVEGVAVVRTGTSRETAAGLYEHDGTARDG